jgi:hypothetical protein
VESVAAEKKRSGLSKILISTTQFIQALPIVALKKEGG